MGPFELAALAVIAGCLLSGYKAYKKNAAKVDKKELDELHAELERLRERVSTLESIVTDHSWDLKREIGRL